MIRELLKKITPELYCIHDIEHTDEQFSALNNSKYYIFDRKDLPVFKELTYAQTVDLINAVADELGEPK